MRHQGHGGPKLAAALLLLATSVGAESVVDFIQGAGGATGVDPSTDGDVTAVWDFSDAVTDLDGVNSLPSAVAGSIDLEQTTGSKKPDAVADGIEGDGTDDELVGVAGVTFPDLFTDTGGYTIVAAIRIPASISTNAAPSAAYQNEAILADSGGSVALWLRSSGPTLGWLIYDGGWNAVTLSVSLSTWYSVAVRYDGVQVEISEDGSTWDSLSASGTGFTSGRTIRMLGNYNASAFTAARFSYLATFDADKLDSEVQDFLVWIDANKIP